MKRLGGILFLLLIAIPARAQYYVRSSPVYVGSTTAVVLRLLDFDQYNVTLTNNTPITFATPIISGNLQFWVNVCENSVGGFTPTFSTASSAVSIVNNVGSSIGKTTANYCETQTWSYRSQTNQLVFEAASPNLSGGGIPGVTVTGTPGGAGQCLSSTGTATAAWGSCGNGNLPNAPATGQLLFTSGTNAVWSAFVSGSDLTASTTTPGLVNITPSQQVCSTSPCPITAMFVTCNATSPISLLLPAAAGSGRPEYVKSAPTSTSTCTLVANGTDNIDGAPTLPIPLAKQAVAIEPTSSGTWGLVLFSYPVPQTLAAHNFATGLNGGVLSGARPASTDLSDLPIPVSSGGTGGISASKTTANNIGAAELGPNSSITSITGLTTPLSIPQGGTGSNSPTQTATAGLSVAGSFPNQTFSLSSPVSVANGGTGQTAPGAAAAHAIGAAAQGANSDITSISGLTTPISVAEGGRSCGSPTTYALRDLVPTAGENCYFIDTNGCSAGTPITGGGGSTPCAVTWTGANWFPAGGATSAAAAGFTNAGTGLSPSGSTISLSVPVIAANGGLGTTTTPTSAQLPVGTASSTYAPQTVSGDATLSNTGALTVTKTGGVSFAPSATTDTTNATNITSGTLPAAQLPNPSASTLGGVQSKTSTTHQFLNTISTSGVPGAAQPASTDLSDLPIPVSSGGTQCGAPTTVAGLPGSPVQGETCNVIDADTCTAGTACVHTTGTTKCTCTWNGTSWLPAGGATSAASGGVTAVNGSGIIASSGGTTPTVSITNPIPVANGGTNATSAGATAANNIGALAQASNLSDVANATTARGNLTAAKSGANSDITSLTGLTTPLSVAQGGSGTATPSLQQGNNVTITGNWPNQTITASNPSPQVPINQLPPQSAKYFANAQGIGNVTCPSTAADVAVEGCALGALTPAAGTFTNANATAFNDVTGPVSTTGLINDNNNSTTIAARNAANTADIQEIGIHADDTIHVGGMNAAGISFDDSSAVSQGTMSSGAYVDFPGANINWSGGTENCANTWHNFTVTANGALTLACPSDSAIHTLHYRFYQPTTGPTFTWSLQAGAGAQIYTPLGGPLPPPCPVNGCYDQITVVWDPSHNIYHANFDSTNLALNSTAASACPAGATCFFFSSATGNDSNLCTQGSPCASTSKAASLMGAAAAGTEFLFKGGDTWSANSNNTAIFFGDTSGHAINGTATNPIVFSTYGTGQAIIDGGNINPYCFASVGPSNAVQYLTINNFECRHTYAAGIYFDAGAGISGNLFQGVTISHNFIHNTGQGCSTTNTTCLTGQDSTADWTAAGAHTNTGSNNVVQPCLPSSGTCTVNAGSYWYVEQNASCTSAGSYSAASFSTTPGAIGTADGTCSWKNTGVQGQYKNQLNWEIDTTTNTQPAGVHITNNTVQSCGGHNCLELHHDTGAFLVSSNSVGPGCTHECLDTKGPGDKANNRLAVISGNYSIAGVSSGNPAVSAYYISSDWTAGTAYVQLANNVGQDAGAGIQEVVSEIFGGTPGSQFCSNIGNPGTNTCPIVIQVYHNTMYQLRQANISYGFTTSGGNGNHLNSTIDLRDNIFDGGNLDSVQVTTSNGGSNWGTITEDYNDIGGILGSAGYTVNGGSTIGAHSFRCTGASNATCNPLYQNVAAANFNLLAGSPCINTGTPINGSSNIGAF